MAIPSLPHTQRLLIYDAYQATVAAGIGASDTTLVVDVTPESFVIAMDGDAIVPVSVLDADGVFVASTYITGWSNYDNEVYIPAWGEAALDGPCTLVCAPNRASMALVQLGQSVEGGEIDGMADYSAEVGLTHHIAVTAAGTINLVEPPSHGTFATTPLPARGQLTRLVLTDADADQPAITVSGTIEWQDGTAPTFGVGLDMLLIELLPAGAGYIGWFRRFQAPA